MVVEIPDKLILLQLTQFLLASPQSLFRLSGILQLFIMDDWRLEISRNTSRGQD